MTTSTSSRSAGRIWRTVDIGLLLADLSRSMRVAKGGWCSVAVQKMPGCSSTLQDDGVPGQRPWGSLYEVKTFWSWREAQSAIKLQGEGGMAVRLKSLETPERPLVPSSTLTIGELGL
jgi:hypothetical protein